MKQLNIGQKSLVIATLLSLTGATFASPSTATSTIFTPETTPFDHKQAFTLTPVRKYRLAQVADSCRQVAPKNGVYVRQQPTVYSTALGIIASGRYVTVEKDSAKGWTQISAPLKGYVFAGYLTSCQPASPPPSNCRQVSARSGVYVRQTPSVNSAVVGVVANERYVTIESNGVNGWVPISVPLKGYVSTHYLTSCS